MLVQVLMQLVLTVALATAMNLMLSGALVLSPQNGTGLALVVAQLAEAVSITLSVFLARRLLDRRSFMSLGLQASRRAIFDVAAGIAVTLIMMGLIFASEYALGWIQVRGFAWSQQPAGSVALATGLSLVIFGLVGWNEELMSRGYHLQTLSSGLTLAWGWILSSAIFALLHLANPHATWASAAGIMLAGLLLGYAFIRTRQLWLPIGIHIGWNFFEGTLFGFPVSGLNVYGLTRLSVDGPEIWTGGAFGPEAGLILVPATLIGFLLTYAYTGWVRTR